DDGSTTMDDAGPMTDSGPMEDAGPEDSGSDDAGGEPTACDRYCDAMEANCSGDNAQYDDRDDCMTYCMESGWPVGTEGETSGNTIECRIYHGGVAAAMEDPATHCPHAGPTGADVCGSVDFRSEDATEYTRVDRMGMPAVSTVLIGSDTKNDYNDANPSVDAERTYVSELADNLTDLHDALDDDLADLGLPACSMTETVDELPECFGQEVVPGVAVADLVVPDTLRIDPGGDPGFPNGRTLPDPVIDVTLSVILLELGADCGGSLCDATTLVGTNPTANDVGDGSFPDTFPYLHPPHTP
ncbi:MAG: DUF4331 family protein, partial [Polyangiales bacterium]